MGQASRHLPVAQPHDQRGAVSPRSRTRCTGRQPRRPPGHSEAAGPAGQSWPLRSGSPSERSGAAGARAQTVTGSGPSEPQLLTWCQWWLLSWWVPCARAHRAWAGEQPVVHVKQYVRADGTKVKAHSRWAAGARREMSVLAIIALVVGFSGASGAGSADGSGSEVPRPRSTAVYPVKFPGWHNPAPRPRPTPSVSYPIPWDRGHRARAPLQREQGLARKPFRAGFQLRR